MTKSQQKYRACVLDALKVIEYELLEVLCVDDDCEPDEYSDWQLVSEATYVKGLYFESGTLSNMAYMGDDGQEAQRAAKNHVKRLTRFINKWTPTLDRKPSKSGCNEPELKNDPIRKNEFVIEL